jgi:hypothetical protein
VVSERYLMSLRAKTRVLLAYAWCHKRFFFLIFPWFSVLSFCVAGIRFRLPQQQLLGLAEQLILCLAHFWFGLPMCSKPQAA